MNTVKFDNENEPKRVVIKMENGLLMIDKEGIHYDSYKHGTESKVFLNGKIISTGEIKGLSIKGLTSQEITKLIMEIKFGILQQAEKALEQALEEKSPGMIAVISGLITSINL
ncbi:hypothetical protein [Enterococcus faecalis]|uniref:hypothetical protein n=1 Tax=Enterococcus faecalis TaxID=1351 RepID=UPI000353AD6B|nr:hypothetical protein [Enterococcus faecalis]EPI39920.1 hypothetical protein D347_00754 [Enterococcus faecalis LA3B-2]